MNQLHLYLGFINILKQLQNEIIQQYLVIEVELKKHQMMLGNAIDLVHHHAHSIVEKE